MKKIKFIFILVTSIILFGCAKDKKRHSFSCGSEYNLTYPIWTDTMSNKLLCGQWKITEVNYTRGTGSKHTFDTTYYPNTILILNQNGSGTYNLDNNEVTWTFKNGVWPQIRITNIGSLYPFPVNFINNNSALVSVQSIPWPNKRFFVTMGGGSNNWEQVWVQFEGQ